MSGEDGPVVELAGAGTAKLIAAVRDVLSGAGPTRCAVIGGLAVLCRCPNASRATQDVDAVTGPDGKSGLLTDFGAAALVAGAATEGAQGSAQRESGDHAAEVVVVDGNLIVNGVKLDVIETHPVVDVDLEGLPTKERLFITAHRWALESATPIRVRVAGRSGSGKGIAMGEATLLVATPAALTAMKLHSIQDRRGRRIQKEASDLEDLYHLIAAYGDGAALAESLAAAPMGLAELVRDTARTVLVEQATDRRRALAVYGPSAPRGIGLDAFREACEGLVDDLELLVP